MEAEHEMELREVRQQLKRVHSKDSKQEEYVRIKKNKITGEGITSFFFKCEDKSLVFFFLSLVFMIA